ncbi:hypothetical protein [Gryllotalpicola ginsengisoli]|uniref:hypothetical protein n=1 Tax=Gryllotalpicola ginsengisoli TaxID=444608 RepID=UPI0012DD8578|nr:hypothetical protein [Gryllotalpicola ginsengisoli]
MRELSSTWVSRHWAATADAASRAPVVVRNHQRRRVVIMDEELAVAFLKWYRQQAPPHDAVEEAAAALEEQQARTADERAVKLLRAKFKARMPKIWTEAHQSIVQGEVPADRAQFEAVIAEYADMEEPWWANW